MSAIRDLFLLSMPVIIALASCDASDPAPYVPPAIDSLDAAAPADGSTGPIGPTGPCLTDFRYVPAPGKVVSSVSVVGEWQNFAAPGLALTGPDTTGAFSTQLELQSGLQAYKLVVDGVTQLDAAQPLRKYVGGVENSAVRARDCRVPLLSLVQKNISGGTGAFSATVQYEITAGALDQPSVQVHLKRDGDVVKTLPAVVNGANSQIAFSVNSLEAGKYTVTVDAKSLGGVAAEQLRLVFWIEPSAFDWRDALIYMTMTDRFSDGDPSNNVPLPSGVDPRASYRGGDLIGIRNAIKSGYLDQLGVRALWISPFNTNSDGTNLADDGVHQTTSYHGYWPAKAREVDARLGGAAALKDLVKEAHAHGIRILMDYVLNHVHEQHEYFKAHPEWFRTGCVCGTNNCDWTAKRLDCLFATYMPDVNWTVPEVSEQYASDATWWMDTFDLDGFRFDAVKHVEDLAVRNVAAAIRKRFEVAGTRVFLTGETAMGWSDCGLACNQSQYDTISNYIGPFGLDGQIDFVLYHAVPYRAFAADAKGMLHADYWAKASIQEYPHDAIMTPYIGSHDTSRFVTISTYRGQDAAHDPGIAFNQWSNYAGPPDGDAYSRHRLGLAWLLGLPGAPLLYYGDEYGEFGGVDPNNRAMWRGAGTLSADETTTLNFVRALGKARKELVALRRGEYRSVYATEDQLVFARQTTAGETALVALNRSTSGTAIVAALPVTLPLANGTVLHDRLGGSDVVVANGGVTINLSARGAAVLAP